MTASGQPVLRMCDPMEHNLWLHVKQSFIPNGVIVDCGLQLVVKRHAVELHHSNSAGSSSRETS